MGRLPIAVTTFLRPLNSSIDFMKKWDDAGLKIVSMRVPLPTAESYSTSGASSASTFAVDSRASLHEDLCCCGALRSFTLPNNVIGLGAELPPHGCVDEGLTVLVRV